MASLSCNQIECIIIHLVSKLKHNQTIWEYIEEYPDRLWIKEGTLYFLDKAYEPWDLESLGESACILVVEGINIEDWLENLIREAESVAKYARERSERQKIVSAFIKRIDNL